MTEWLGLPGAQAEPAQKAANSTRLGGEGGYSLARLLRGAALYSTSDLALKVAGLFLIPIYTRVLTPTDYGIIGYATAVIQILSPAVGLGAMGAVPMLYYAYGEHQRRRLVGTLVNFTLVYALAVSVLLTLFGEPLFRLASEQVAFDPYMLLAIWTVFATALYFLPLNILNMQERPGAYAGYAFGIGLFGILLNIVFVVVLGAGAEGALWAGLLTGVLGTVGAAGVLARGSYAPVIDWAKLRESLALVLPTLPHTFAAVLWRFADRLFLAGMASLAATGIYTLALTLASVTLMVLGGITTALNPMFYRRAYARDPDLPRDWARLSSLCVFAAAAVGLALALLGGDLIRIATPEPYHAAAAIIPVLVLSQIVLGLYGLLHPAIAYTRKTWVYTVASFTSVTVNLALLAVTVPRFGATGAAWSLVGTALVQTAVFGYFSQRYFPIHYEKRQLATVVLAVIPLYVLGAAVSEPLSLSVAVKALVVVLLPCILALAGFFSRREIDGVLRIVSALAKRLTAYRRR